jgi:hypothetical protein
MPVARPANPVCNAALYADLHTSLLFTTTDGAFAVGGVLSVTTVELTVLVSADTPKLYKLTVHITKRYFNIFILSPLYRPLFV